MPWMVIKQMYIDNNAWIQNLWFPILAEFKGRCFGTL